MAEPKYCANCSVGRSLYVALEGLCAKGKSIKVKCDICGDVWVDYEGWRMTRERAMMTEHGARICDFVEKFGLPKAHIKQIMDGNVDLIVDALIDAVMANAKRLDEIDNEERIGRI